mmetsp:Transcript_25471/g.47527  ORF Transcript_25471/g.47527 Transcript_25471/m.47527 type:complete len:108 (-) Transcript_25471:191-514(-)
MPGEAHPAFTVGGLVFAGGLIGFIKSSSKGSLIGGAIIGAGFAGAGMLITKGEGFQGHALASTCALSLAGMFGRKLLKGGGMVPAIYTFIGLASLTFHGKKAVEWKE